MTDALYFLGPEGTFAHAAAQAVQRRHGGPAKSTLTAVSAIFGVFEQVARDEAALGVVPIENSTEGSVSFTLDALTEFESVLIVGEEVLPVEQCLLGSGTIGDICAVRSHPHGLAQCKRWLRAHLPNVELIPESSTAAAAHAVGDRPDQAAIASELAGQVAGLSLLVRGVQDGEQNATRFLVLGRRQPPPTGADKTSVVFRTRHERGALYSVLGVFNDHGINLSRIESRPMPGALWEYVFFADLEGHADSPAVAGALARMTYEEHKVRVLGSYPAAKTTASSGATQRS